MLNNDFFVALILYRLFTSPEEREEKLRDDLIGGLVAIGVLAIAGIIFFIGLKLGW